MGLFDFTKKDSSIDRNTVRNKITVAFEENIESTIKNQLVGDSNLDGLILKSSIRMHSTKLQRKQKPTTNELSISF